MDSLPACSSLRLWPFLILFVLSPCDAQENSRVWTFEAAGPGTYKFQVHYPKDNPPGSPIHYQVHTDEKDLERSLPFMDGIPNMPLIAQVTHAQTLKFTISGVPDALLAETDVYAYERNTHYPDEYLDPDNSARLEVAQHIRSILAGSEEDIDLAKAKLLIDKAVDPLIDIDVSLGQIEQIVSEVRNMAGPGASDQDTLLALKRYIYEQGAWNGYNAYHYDFDDPLGTKISNKLLPHYLDTKKGNCTTMPFLFVILGQRLGIDVHAASAPLHVFVKFRDRDTGAIYNLETTSGANPARDSWYRQNLPMSQQAVDSGVYLRALSKKETVALMLEVLLGHYMARKEYEKAITIADLTLAYYPKYALAMVKKGSAYYGLLDRYYMRKYPDARQIPARLRGYFHYLSNNNIEWFAKAEALGWREMSEEDDERYLQAVSRDAALAK